MTTRSRRLLGLLGTTAAMTAAALPVAQARQGADDPANHDVNDDHGGLVVNHTTARRHEARHHHRHGRHHRRHDR